MADARRLDILRQVRRAQKINLTDMGDYFGFGKGARIRMGQWENGEEIPSPAHRVKFISYLLDKLHLVKDPERFNI